MDILMFAWLAGIIMRIRNKVSIRTEELAAFLFAGLILFSFLPRYGDARYLFPVQALAIMFAPYSLYLIWQQMCGRYNTSVVPRLFPLGVTAVSLFGIYQLSFNSYIADSYQNIFYRDIHEYFSSLPKSTVIFFYNTPHAVLSFQGDNYYQKFAIFEKWILGSDFENIVKNTEVDMLVLHPHLTLHDQSISLDKYEVKATFNKVIVMERKSLQ